MAGAAAARDSGGLMARFQADGQNENSLGAEYVRFLQGRDLSCGWYDFRQRGRKGFLRNERRLNLLPTTGTTISE